jgi:multidrug resistance efflux pump
MKLGNTNQELPRVAPRVLVRRKELLIASFAVAIAVVAAWFIRGSMLYESTDDAHVDGHILPLSTRINAQVQQVNVIDRQLVRADDVLAVMDQRDCGIAVCKALANLAYAENIAAILYYDAAITVSSAHGDLMSAQASLAKAKAQAADSQVMQRKAELEQAQLNLSYTIIRSPVTGIIGRRRVEVGQNVSVGQEVIDVVSLNDVWIMANFKETQLGHLKPGQPVEIRVDAYSRTWKGHVTNLGGGAGAALSAFEKNVIGNYAKVVQRVPVRIDFDRPQSQTFNAEGLLKPGLSVEPAVRVRWLRRTSTAPERQPGSREAASGPFRPSYGSLSSWTCLTAASQRSRSKIR